MLFQISGIKRVMFLLGLCTFFALLSAFDASPISENENFELVYSIKAENYLPVHKYKSKRTGLTVVIGGVEGPTVNGYFCLATEAHDDDGLPHTLEHLVFLGSEDYPFKGILDLLANRCLAQGTNAWTDTDHTCYTMITAGSEGFLTLLPIYLDHILYPLLTPNGYITEVHHITGDGNDAGVVYSEMQARENTGESRVHLETLRQMYPGECGYKSETGGILKNLRESTSNTKVVNYHKAYYRAENLVVIITGPVKHSDVFKTIEKVEDKILKKGNSSCFDRPWQSAVPPLKKSVEQTVKYPSDEEDNGLVDIAWRGPSAVSELYEMTACSILLKYLTDTSVSPLQQEFVEIDDPYASSVSYGLIENSASLLEIQFESVPISKVDAILPKLLEVLDKFKTGKEVIDMKRLQTVIHRFQLEKLGHLERSPHGSIAFTAIGDFLYGRDNNDFKQRFSNIEDLKRMAGEPIEFWVNLLTKYLVDSPKVTTKGVPSIETQKEMMAAEEQRVKKQIEELGPEGLKAKAKELENAIEFNNLPAPEEVLRSVPIPGVDTIQHHKILRCTTDTANECPRYNLEKIPFYTQLDHVNTNFVYMYFLLDSTDLSPELRSYLLLYLDTLLESPVLRDGNLIPYSQIVSEIEDNTISCHSQIGLDMTSRFSCGSFSQTVVVMVMLEESKYAKVVQLLSELLYRSVFTQDRLKVLITKMLNDVAQSKRSGGKIVEDLTRDAYFHKHSNVYSSMMMRQQQFLQKLMEKLNGDGADEVIADMEKVRGTLTDPKNMVLHLALNLDHINGEEDVWSGFLPEKYVPTKQKLHVTADHNLMSYNSSKPNCIVGVGSVESAYLKQTTPSITDYNDPDLPALLVFLIYITQLEGPMWKKLRGNGLTYSYSIRPTPHDGLLTFTLARAANISEAYKEAKIMLNYYVEAGEFEQTLFESAKSSLVFSVVSREENIGDVVQESLLAYFKNVDANYNRETIKAINKVTIEDLRRVGKKYVAPLFDAEKSKTTVVCNPGNIQKIVKELKECDLDLTIFNSVEDSYLNKW